jgi:uncharacterized protein (TIGR02301 family)
MRPKFILIASCASVLALGSVVALAQTAPPEAASEATTPSPALPAEASVPESVPAAPASAPQAAPVEDAPVDVPTNAQSDWAPDINLDAQIQADTAKSTTQRKAKPRKILSDAGENVLGTGGWAQGSNSAAAQAQLLSRESRRERAVDPVKRSELTKLSRVMGALHALRVSCAGREDQTYRSRMATLLDLEAPSNGELRDPLVDAFNGGFQAYGRGASACPSDARVQEASLAKEGYMVSRQLSVRYRPVPKPAAVLPPANQPRQNVPPAVKTAAVVPTTPVPPAPPRATWNATTGN